MGKFQQESRVFQALAHPVRLQILEALARRPACVCDLVMLTRRQQAYLSQHLARLREVELVRYERSGLNVFYRVNAARLADVLQVLRPFFPLPSDDLVMVKVQGDDKVSDNQNNNGQWHGVPRAEIQWHPTVIPDRCVGCGLCATSCGRGVYAFDERPMSGLHHPAQAKINTLEVKK